MKLRTSLIAALLAALFLAGALPALAQSRAPIGTWRTIHNEEGLVIMPNGSCGFLSQGRVAYSGVCSWNPSYAGGILTLSYPMPLEPGHIRWSVIWVNSKTIKVDGDVFHKYG